MANKTSAKKAARQSVKRQAINVARKTSIKTAFKKVTTALQEGKTEAEIQKLFNDAQSKCARAKGKKTLHAKTASRKVSRLALKVKAHFEQPVAEVKVTKKTVAKKAKK
ncbi:30S ribosomal protein S20 [Candidatus Dependentiae bacterium]|nr:30S ribosomal protein S20 [Candidatus Dependentiae bacterium]